MGVIATDNKRVIIIEQKTIHFDLPKMLTIIRRIKLILSLNTINI